MVHVHSPYVAGIARLVARSFRPARRPRIVYTEHLPWPGYVLPTRWLNAFTFPLDDAHVAVSDAVRDSVWKPLATHLRTVVHGIPLEHVRQRTDGSRCGSEGAGDPARRDPDRDRREPP